MKSLAIVLMCVAAAIAHGIAHASVTARICIESFTIRHPLAQHTPPSLTLAVGVPATWWLGVIGGGLWAFSARFGPKPKLEPSFFARPLLLVMIASALAACFVGMLGHELAVNHIIVLQGDLARDVPEDRHVAFLTCSWAHSASYVAAALGLLAVAVWTWRKRGRSAQPS